VQKINSSQDNKFNHNDQKINKVIRKLILFGFVTIITANVLSILLLSQYDMDLDISLFHTEAFLTFSEQTFQDSWKFMELAIEYLKGNHQETVYEHLFFYNKMKFQYPLSSLLPIIMLESIFPQSGSIKFLSWISVIVTLIFIVKIFRFVIINYWSSRNELSGFSSLCLSLIVAIFGITFYPLVKAYTLGQIQTVIDCLSTIAFWYWLTNRKISSGFLIGIISLIKPTYIIIVFWGIIRRNWHFVLSAISVFALGSLISLLLFGFENNIDYLKVLMYISQHGESFYPNQSINGLLNRLFFNGSNLVFEEHSFPPFNPMVYLGTAISSFILIILAFFYPMRYKFSGDILDYSIIMITATIASPIAWEHHYGVFLPIYAFLSAYLLEYPDSNRKILFLVAFSYIFVSNFFIIINILADIPILNMFQSYLLIAALILLHEIYIMAKNKNLTIRC
jgi:alpha-1,2-mannosyltransferase